MMETKVRLYGSEKFNPEQLKRFEQYVDDKYPAFHYRKRRRYAKEVLKHSNKQIIQSHIYSGVKEWESSPTLVKRLLKVLRNLAAYLSGNIKELKPKKLFRKLKLQSQKINGLHIPSVVEIGVMETRGGKRCITGTVVKIFLLMNRLLNILGLSLRLSPSALMVKILRIKPEQQYREGTCQMCGNKLGHWYRDVEDNINGYVGSVHYLCELPIDKEGVLI